MNAPKFTPGPWEACGRTVVVTEATHDYSMHIADCNTGGSSYGTQCANSRLIAAAPELYEALEAVITECESLAGDGLTTANEPAALTKARAALAKAQGGDA